MFSTIVVFAIFVFTGIMFLFYNHLVDKRQNVVMDQANRTTAIVSSLFPESVTKRLIAEHKGSNEKNNDADNNDKFQSANRRIQSFLKSAGDETADSNQARVEQKPIADLFPYTTVLFAGKYSS